MLSRSISVLLLFIVLIEAERCPPIFGEYECPIGFLCKDGQCFNKNAESSTTCPVDIDCPVGTVCADGKCYPVPAIKCNRHVLTADGLARSIVSDCGRKGKCVNGQCVLDRCMGVSCEDGELCRDGECVKMIDIFCIGHADCGPNLECKNNKCILQNADPICNCQPHEICHHGQCYPNSACTNIYCGPVAYCVEGQCVNAVGVDCRQDTCHGGTVCVNGVCAVDPCPGRCPVDQDCRNGECRLMEGLICNTECKAPYECVDGRCRRNDCSRRICQIGESCENGQCARVVGRFCTWAPRDCGHAFLCQDNKCVDTLQAVQPTSGLVQTNQLKIVI